MDTGVLAAYDTDLLWPSTYTVRGIAMGGALKLFSGSMTLSNVRITRPLAQSVTGRAFGGALHVDDGTFVGSQLSLVEPAVVAGLAPTIVDAASGGALHILGGKTTVTDSSIIGSRVSGDGHVFGGAISIYAGSLAMLAKFSKTMKVSRTHGVLLPLDDSWGHRVYMPVYHPSATSDKKGDAIFAETVRDLRRAVEVLEEV